MKSSPSSWKSIFFIFIGIEGIIQFFKCCNFFFLNFFLDQGPFCGATDCSCFGLGACVLPHGFQSQSGYLTCTRSCLCAVILKVTTGATLAFSTNRDVHCISMYTACLARLLSHASGFEPQHSGELLSGAWLSQTRYWLSYSAGPNVATLLPVEMYAQIAWTLLVHVFIISINALMWPSNATGQ